MNSQSLGERTVSPCLSCSSSSPVAFAMAATTVRGRILHPGLSTSHCRVPGSSRSHNFSMFITDAPTFEISLCMKDRTARCGQEAAGLHVSPPWPVRLPSVVPAPRRVKGLSARVPAPERVPGMSPWSSARRPCLPICPRTPSVIWLTRTIRLPVASKSGSFSTILSGAGYETSHRTILGRNSGNRRTEQ